MTTPDLDPHCYYCGQVPEGLAGAFLLTPSGRVLVRLCRSRTRYCFQRATTILPSAAPELAADTAVTIGVLAYPRWTLAATHPALGTRALFTCPSEVSARHLATRIDSFVASTLEERLVSLSTMRDHITWRRSFAPSPHLRDVENMLAALEDISRVLE